MSGQWGTKYGVHTTTNEGVEDPPNNDFWACWGTRTIIRPFLACQVPRDSPCQNRFLDFRDLGVGLEKAFLSAVLVVGKVQEVGTCPYISAFSPWPSRRNGGLAVLVL